VTIEVEVVDLGINNLASLTRGFTSAGDVDLRVIADASETRGADLMVLPGVGAYGAAIAELRQRGLDTVVTEHAAAGLPLFGVCLGMQLLVEGSEESPGVPGLGLIKGSAHKLEATGDARVPNMGWGGADATDKAGPFAALTQPYDFYFVHSFAVVPDDPDDILIRSEFGGRSFVSGLFRDNVLGLQFHPEKSSSGGARLLSEIVSWAHG
jgi:imidazole glycerol-phosphate synthase subunit HisH